MSCDSAHYKEALNIACGILWWVPPEEIIAWAENHLELPEGATQFPGRLRFEINPYVRGPLRAWNSGKFREVWLIWGAQTGKTLALQIAIAYVIDQIPGPAMYTCPDRDTAKKRVDNNLKPFLTEMEYMRRHLTGREDDLSTFNMKFLNVVLRVGWAGSGSSMAAESIQYAFGDEAAKWERRDKKEAHPLKLFMRRLISFKDNARAFFVTTPNTEDRPGWKELEDSTFHECFIPCPHCGDPSKLEDVPELELDRSQDELKDRLKEAGYQRLVWENITGWGEERDPDKVAALTIYKCEHCGKEITDAEKVSVMNIHKWIPRTPGKRRAGFHLPSWYSRQVDFADVARRFFESRGDPKDFQDWWNSDRALPFREGGGKKKTKDEIKAHIQPYASKTIPFVPVLLTLTVDVQEDEFFYVVGAWGEFETFAVVQYGMLPRLGRRDREDADRDTSMNILDKIMERTYFDAAGNEYAIDFAGIDSGFDEVQVYTYVKRLPNAAAMHGQAAQKAILNYSRPETITMPSGKKKVDQDSANLISWNTNYFRNLLAMRLDIPAPELGSISLPSDTDDEFCFQMIGTIKIKKRGQWIWWDEHRNHYYDCITQQYVLAKMLEVKDMKVREDPKPDNSSRSSPQPSSGNWINMHRRQ